MKMMKSIALDKFMDNENCFISLKENNDNEIIVEA